jgi:tight adherence protein B
MSDPIGASRVQSWRSPAPPLARLHPRLGSYWQRSSLPAPFARFAFEADLTDDHLNALVLWLGFGTAISGAVLALVGMAQSIVMGAAVVAVPLLVARQRAGRRTRRLVAALPDVVDMIGRSLRSGASLTQALREAAADGPSPVGGELAVVVGGVGRGQPTPLALQAWVERIPRPEVRIVAAALALASRNEAGTMRALDGVSHSLRDRAALTAEIRSQSAQAAVSMQALVLMPALFLGIDAIGSQRTVRFLTEEPSGQVCLVVAVVLGVVGWLWMAAIIRRRSPQ